MGLLAGLGVTVFMPASMVRLHDFLHEWEIPMIVFSGVILLLGWAVTLWSDRMDCHSSGCGHGACAPRKSRAHIILKIATLLFVVNLVVFFAFHRGAFVSEAAITEVSRAGENHLHGGDHSHSH